MLNAIIIGTLVAQASVATEVTPGDFVRSARGPGVGNIAIGVGGAIGSFGPMFDARIAVGLPYKVDLQGRLTTNGFRNLARLGGAYRVVKARKFTLGLGLGVWEGHEKHKSEAWAVAVGPSGRLAASVGGPRWQLTLSMQVDHDARQNRTYVRPEFATEFVLWEGATGYVTTEALIDPSIEDDDALVVLTAGIAF